MQLVSVVGIALAAGLAAPPLPAQEHAARSGDDLVGLWGGETTFGPEVRGGLTLVRHGGNWTLRVGSFEVSTPDTGDTVRLALPGGKGTLRAHLEDSGHAVRGFWVQPPHILGAYASPVSLERVGADAWRGFVAPQDERFSLYMLVKRRGGDTLSGTFRNPEANWTGRAPWFRVEEADGTIAFMDPATGRARFHQPYDSVQRQIAMDFGGPLVLTPRTPGHAVGFFPRTPTGEPYSYRPPLVDGDGWRTARAAELGMDEDSLQNLVRHIIATDPVGTGQPLIHSVVVARHGRLVLDEYFFGFAADQPHDLRSASKTFTSVMAGIAMDRGAAFTMQTPVYPLFERDTAAADLDPRKRRITVGQLLTHSSGLACDDNDDDSPGNEDRMQGERAQPDWYRFTLDLPVAHEPGTTYAYCSAGINLVGGVIRNATGTWLPDFFDRYVARPLKIEHYAVNLMPSGEAYAAGGVSMRPRDLLKFGQLYLDGGVWQGIRVVSARWVRQSTEHQMDAPNGGSDGYGWHRNMLVVGGRSYQEYEANGNGGQFLIVVPELDLAVVVTAGNYGQYPVWRKIRDELVPRYVLAAVKGR